MAVERFLVIVVLNPALVSLYTYLISTFDNFNDGSLFETFDAFQFGEVVQGLSVQLQREAGAMTGVFTVHEHVVELLH